MKAISAAREAWKLSWQVFLVTFESGWQPNTDARQCSECSIGKSVLDKLQGISVDEIGGSECDGAIDVDERSELVNRWIC